ncbi:MAG: hypothetical protein IT392_13510 [Nitrospirae bacterium]|nr:hypothetical protein [Nitrospirota bacterium]
MPETVIRVENLTKEYRLGIINHGTLVTAPMIREFEVMRGNGIKRRADSEKTTRINNRKSIVIISAVKKGEAII